MCVITVKKAGADLPKKNILKQAAVYNPHGFGFCTPTKTYKTLSFNKFENKLKTVKKDEPCIIHLRYATKGSVKLANCHPFKENKIKFAHNGHLNIETQNDMTDSETFFKGNLMKIIDKHGYNSDNLEKFIYEKGGYSKFALMKGKNIRMFGNYENFEGCYYSNLRFINNYYYNQLINK